MMKSTFFVTTLFVALSVTSSSAAYADVVARTVEEAKLTPAPTPCPEALTDLGNACQCHLIRIHATHPFKRISFEGLMQGCRNQFGPEVLWSAACTKLTGSHPFTVKEAIAAVRELVDTCPGHPICDFFVINEGRN